MGVKNALLALVVQSCCCCLVYSQCQGFKNPPSNVTIQQGEGMTISCDHGIIVIAWYQGTTEIIGADQEDSCSCVSELVEGSTEKNLTFTSITTVNAGTYGCWTQNANSTFTMCNFEVVVTVPPTISLSEDDIEDATLGGNLTITPDIINLGIPEADITWLYSLNGATVTLSPDSRVEISDEGVLTVRGVQASDRGTYTVRASNGVGTDAEASVDVTIEFLELDGPIFEVLDMGGLTVTCNATGYPKGVMIDPSPSQSNSVMTVNNSTFEEMLSVSYTYDTCKEIYYKCTATAGDMNITSTGLPSCTAVSTTVPPPTTSSSKALHIIASFATMCVAAVIGILL